MKKLLLLPFLFLTLTLSAQIKTPLIDLLGKPTQSKEVTAFMSRFKNWEKEDITERATIYKSSYGGIAIETFNDTVRRISIFQDGEVYEGGTDMSGYKGELPYGLRMNMTRGDVVKVLGEPEVMDGLSMEDYAIEMTGSYPSKKIRFYYTVDDENEGPGWKDPRDKFSSISIGDISDEYVSEVEEE
jgi:hypothetical protein